MGKIKTDLVERVLWKTSHGASAEEAGNAVGISTSMVNKIKMFANIAKSNGAEGVYTYIRSHNGNYGIGTVIAICDAVGVDVDRKALTGLQTKVDEQFEAPEEKEGQLSFLITPERQTTNETMFAILAELKAIKSLLVKENATND